MAQKTARQDTLLAIYGSLFLVTIILLEHYASNGGEKKVMLMSTLKFASVCHILPIKTSKSEVQNVLGACPICFFANPYQVV